MLLWRRSRWVSRCACAHPVHNVLQKGARDASACLPLNPTLPCSALPPLSPLQDVAFDHVTDKKKRSLQKWKREWGVVAVDNFIDMVDVVPLVRNAQSLLGQDAGALHVQGYLRSQGDGVGVSRIRDAQRTLDAAAVARRTHFSRFLKVGTYVGRS